MNTYIYGHCPELKLISGYNKTYDRRVTLKILIKLLIVIYHYLILQLGEARCSYSTAQIHKFPISNSSRRAFFTFVFLFSPNCLELHKINS